MSGSVAGKIRIDILTNAAQFNGEMKSMGTDGLGGFQQQYEQTVKKVTSQKSIAESIQREKESWKVAMNEVRKDMTLSRADNMRMLSLANMNMTHDPALDASIRHKSMIPWGNSYRTELTHEAAETAARIGKEMGQVKSAWGNAMRDISGSQLGGLGSGIGNLLGGAIGWMSAHPVAATVGAGALLAGGKYVGRMRENENRSAQVMRDKDIIGQSARDTYMLTESGIDVGMISKYQNAMSQDKGAFKELGLDADKLASGSLKEALLATATAFNNIDNASKKAELSMAIFGRSGAEMIPVLKSLSGNMGNLREETIAANTDVAGKRRESDAEKGLSSAVNATMDRGRGLWDLFTSMKTALYNFGEDAINSIHGDEQDIANTFERRRKLEASIANAPALEKASAEANKLADAQKRAADEAKRMTDMLAAARKDYGALTKEASAINLADNYFGGDLEKAKIEAENREMEKKWKASGMSPAQIANEREQRESDRKNVKNFTDRRLSEDLYSGMKKSTDPLYGYKENMKEPERLYEDGKMGLKRFSELRMEELRKYYAAASGLEANRINEELKTPVQLYEEKMKWLRAMNRDGLLTNDATTKFGEKNLGDLRKSLGVTDPLGDYSRNLKDLRDARDAGLIDPDQYAKRKKRLRKSALDELTSDIPDVAPANAMAAGSMEAYNFIAKAMMGSPKDEAAQKGNQLLSEIDKKLEVIADNARQPPQVPVKAFNLQ